MDHIRRVVIGLGSNLGDRSHNINTAVQRLRQDADMHVRERSILYETDPVGGRPQGKFLNGAVLVLTALPADTLHERLCGIEWELGRIRAEKNAPRTIDLDILWIEGESLREGAVIIPHPRLHERSFALVPLLELAPDACDDAGNHYADLPAAQVILCAVAD